MAHAKYRSSLEMEEETWSLPPSSCGQAAFPSLAYSSITPFLGNRHRRDRGVALESIQISHLHPKGIIEIRWNEIRKFAPRCLKDSE